MSRTLVALWIAALILFPQGPQSCNGDCPDGYRSVCVQRGGACKCACIKDVASGVTSLRELLHHYNVSETTIDAAVSRYRELAGQTTQEFSFTVNDIQTGEWTIRGQGLLGYERVDPIAADTIVESANLTPKEGKSQPPKKIRYTKKNLSVKKRRTKQAAKS